MEFETRKEWRNHGKNQQAVPLRIYHPRTLDDLVAIVHDAQRLGVHVRAVGSAHSWSDAAVTPDFLVAPDGLTGPLPIDEREVLANARGRKLVRVRSGTTLRELNEHLDHLGLALPNMGGYDGQTIVGATCTSTHGSGMGFGPLCEMIRSYDIVDGRGRVQRIEPGTDPISDPAAFASAYGEERDLVQNDEVFHAMLVSIGSLGLVYSVVLEVVPAFWLKEVRTITTWEEVKKELRKGWMFKDKELHYELLLCPYAINDSHSCLVTTRVPTPPRTTAPRDKLKRHAINELVSSFFLTGLVLRALFNWFPRGTPARVDKAVRALKDDEYSNKSYKVFNIGTANRLPSLSAEHAVPMANDAYIEAMDALLKSASLSATAGDIYQSGPIAVRFVRGTQALLSPMFERDTAMFEIITVGGTRGSEEIMFRYEEVLRAFEARPHWGQVNHLAGSEAVGALYPSFERWRRVRGMLDPEGRFSNPMTTRLGMDLRSSLESAPRLFRIPSTSPTHHGPRIAPLG